MEKNKYIMWDEEEKIVDLDPYECSWIGLRLTKKRSIYLNILCTIGTSFFASSIIFTLPVFQFIMTNISPDDELTYFYTLLLFTSNFIASVICIIVFSLTLSKDNKFRKAVKKQ